MEGCRVDGWMGGQVDRWTDRWIDGRRAGKGTLDVGDGETDLGMVGDGVGSGSGGMAVYDGGVAGEARGLVLNLHLHLHLWID